MSTQARPACVLAFETTAEPYSVALLHESNLTCHRHSGERPVAEVALAMAADLLAQEAIPIDRVDAFAFSGGPGPFTGLRVGCGLAQGLAFARQRPVVGVGSLRAMAVAAVQLLTAAGGAESNEVDQTEPRRVLVAVDARMNQAYWAVYEFHPWRELAQPALAPADRMAELQATWRPHLLVGSALRAFESAWPTPSTETRMPHLTVDATVIAALAAEDLMAGRSVAARDAAPIYVRDQVALTVAQREALKQARAGGIATSAP